MQNRLGTLTVSLCVLGMSQVLNAADSSIKVGPLGVTIDEVDGRHGTADGGNMFPVAVRPYGLASIGPDIKYDIASFSCTHLQGAGGIRWNYCAPAFVLTTGPVSVDPATWKATYKDYSLFEARADGVRVKSESLGFAVEIVATLRGGVVVAKSINDKPLNILFPLCGTPRNEGGDYALSQKGNVWTIEGGIKSSVYVHGSFVCEGATAAGTWNNSNLTAGAGEVKIGRKGHLAGVYLTIPPGKELRMRLGISFTSLEGARRNLAAEVPDTNVQRIRAEAGAEWQAQLDLLRVTGGSPSQRRLYATALYRSFLAPHVFEDVDRQYVGFFNGGKKDKTVCTLAASRQHQYATFSGWDTFRTQMPLVALVDPKRYSDMCNSMLEMDNLPRWPLANRPLTTMCGAPLQNMLASGWYHGVTGVDWSKAQALMKKTLAEPLANTDCLGNDYNGTVAVATLAAALGDRATTETWWAKTLGYRAFYDAGQKVFVNSKKHPVGNEEGSKQSYVFYNGMWDPDGLAKVLGGHEKALTMLRNFMDNGAKFGNENDIHVPFLATLWGNPDLTAAVLPGIINAMAKDASPMGRNGNDDLGTMSAWLVLAQIGIYPINPAAGVYVLSAPAFPEVTINFQRGGKPLVITGGGNLPKTIRKATWNGTALDRPWLLAKELIQGGRLDLVCGTPPTTWCRSPKPVPTPLEMLDQKKQ